MKKLITIFGAILFASVLLSSCSSTKLVSTGSKDNKPLLFNGEYETKNLKEIQVDGSAFLGIPSYSKNNKNNRNTGFLFTFNGVELGKTKRIMPILTLIGYSFITQIAVQRLVGQKTETDYFEPAEYRLGFVPSYIIGLPVAGMLNNLTWSNSALSGASATLNQRLISENPDIDVFFYPKYEITKKSVFSKDGMNLKYLFMQDGTLKARVSGAKLIHK
jgi:hypothetical protein